MLSLEELKEAVKIAAEEWVKAQDCWATDMTDYAYERVRDAEDAFDVALDALYTKKVKP